MTERPVIIDECHGCGVEDVEVRDYADPRYDPPRGHTFYLCEFCANTQLGNYAAYPLSADTTAQAVGRMIAWSHHRIMRAIGGEA